MTATTTDILLTESIKSIFNHQKKYAATINRSTASERIAKLKKLETLIMTNEKKIQEAIYNDFRKPHNETTLSEVYPVLSELRHTIKHLKGWLKPKRVPASLAMLGTTAQVYHEAKGVALIISPWNYPFQLAISPLISAIAGGNCAVIKPSELSPNTSVLLSRLIKEFAKEEEITVIEGGVEVSTALLALPFDHIFFTGSPAIGKVVMKAASQNLTSVTLELGGKSPVVIDETADLKDVAEKLIWGKCLNAGQTCIAPDYVLVPEHLKSQLVELLKNQINIYYNTDNQGIENSASFARVINHRNFLRLIGLIDEAVTKGATVAFGGKRNENTLFLEPTLLTDVTHEMRVMQEEIFGAVLPILTYRTHEEALKLIGKLDKPLAFYIFSRSNKNIAYFLSNSTAGGSTVNDCMLHVGHPDLPFGGINNSGIGKSHGYAGFLEFVNQRAVLRQRIGATTVKMFYPPYTPKVTKLLKLLVKWL